MTLKRRTCLLIIGSVVTLGAGGVFYFRFFRPAMELGYVDSAIGTLRVLSAAERKFDQEHSGRGYACNFSDLDLQELPKGFAQKGQRVSYIFELSCSDVDEQGSQGFQVTARPIVKGMAAFCVDQSGVVKYDESGSTAGCLRRGKPLGG